MIRYTGIHGSGDAGENGIWTADGRRQVLSTGELDKLGVDLMNVISRDYSDSTIEILIAKNDERMARNRRERNCV